MKLTITHREKYSRIELLLRTFFGWLYMAIPHGFLLLFLGIWSGILTFVAFWVVLITGKYPAGMFSYQVEYSRWGLRLGARLINLADGYPAFGLSAQDELIEFEIPLPEKQSRLLLLLRLFFGGLYVGIPHGFLLFFRTIATSVVIFIAWWIVLFTGRYPASLHEYVIGLLRWTTRVKIYMIFLTDDYPPFNGKAIE
jgi:hypothetical protein